MPALIPNRSLQNGSLQNFTLNELYNLSFLIVVRRNKFINVKVIHVRLLESKTNSEINRIYIPWSQITASASAPASASASAPASPRHEPDDAQPPLSGARSLTVTDTQLTFRLRCEPGYNSIGMNSNAWKKA